MRHVPIFETCGRQLHEELRGFFGAFNCSSVLFWLCNAALLSVPAKISPPAKFTLPSPDSAQTQKYLGLQEMAPFTLAQTNTKLVIVEFFSAICTNCLANAPTENKVYKLLQEDPGLADTKLIGIAVQSLFFHSRSN